MTPRRGWEDNIRMDIRGTGYENVELIQLNQYSVSTVMNLWVP